MSGRTFCTIGGVVGIGAIVGMLASGSRPAAADSIGLDTLAFTDATGLQETYTVNGAFDFDNPFFQDLGTNGRRCVTCHQPTAAWTITAANVQSRFAASGGTDPIFRSNDGSNCEGANPSTLSGKQAAYSLLLTRGVIRVGLDLPTNAEFVIDNVTNPYGCGPASTDTSLYRRPLPATNLRFLSAVMWDGRESSSTTDIAEDLAHQANDATRGHAQATQDLTPDEAQQIVSFETGLFTAQAVDGQAGRLTGHGADGGPAALSQQPFFIGINDPVKLNPTGASFNPNTFTVFDAWAALPGSGATTAARQAIARGQAIFNSKGFTISGVGGLNGQTFASGVTVASSFTGTCTVCHDAPNAGSHSIKAPLDLGLTTPARAPYLPVYTLRNLATQQTVQTTDPGRAMITGKWADIGKFKGPVLRALAARAPYFHNGSAATLSDVVDFYDTRFNIGFSPQEKADLLAFLASL